MRLPILACLLVVSASTAAAELQPVNTGGMSDYVPMGNVITDSDALGAAAVLYCPSEADDPALRAAISAALSGATVDYFDGRAGSPDLALLMNYDCAFTWANFAFFDNVAMGDVLADFVDAGGSVVLGSFCTYTSGNFLSGRVMTDSYSPVWSPSGSSAFSPSDYSGDGTTCIHNGVSAYNSQFRDILSTQGGGAIDGTYNDGVIGHAYRVDYAVVYSNGAGGVQLGGTGDFAIAIGNSCMCVAGTPVEEKTWSAVKSLF